MFSSIFKKKNAHIMRMYWWSRAIGSLILFSIWHYQESIGKKKIMESLNTFFVTRITNAEIDKLKTNINAAKQFSLASIVEWLVQILNHTDKSPLLSIKYIRNSVLALWFRHFIIYSLLTSKATSNHVDHSTYAQHNSPKRI